MQPFWIIVYKSIGNASILLVWNLTIIGRHKIKQQYITVV